jgi:hypothetical protein
MEFRFHDRKRNLPIPKGFYYVDQDNYYIANLNKPNANNPEQYLYSDSATSCIIVIVEGLDTDSNPIVALTHLSRPERFATFFEIVEKTFLGPVNVFAQGANPSDAAASQTNSEILLAWIEKNRTSAVPATWSIANVTLSLGLGNPQKEDRGTYGIDLVTMTVSNDSFDLTLLDRDPTGGLQILYCVFGLQVTPPVRLHHRGTPFTDEEIRLLVAEANLPNNNWVSFLNKTQAEILTLSSTPTCEVPWFYAEVRSAALYVKNHRII